MDGDSIALHGVTEESTTADVKRQLLHADKVYAVRLQRLMIQQPCDEFAVCNLTVRLLARLGIQGECVVVLMMRATDFAASSRCAHVRLIWWQCWTVQPPMGYVRVAEQRADLCH